MDSTMANGNKGPKKPRQRQRKRKVEPADSADAPSTSAWTSEKNGDNNNNSTGDATGSSAQTSLEQEKQFFVEDITDVKVGRYGKLLYNVRWIGFTEEDDTWEPMKNMIGEYAHTRISEFEEENKEKIERLLREWREKEEARKSAAAQKKANAVFGNATQKEATIDAPAANEENSPGDEETRELNSDDEYFGEKIAEVKGEKKLLVDRTKLVSPKERKLASLASSDVMTRRRFNVLSGGVDVPKVAPKVIQKVKTRNRQPVDPITGKRPRGRPRKVPIQLPATEVNNLEAPSTSTDVTTNGKSKEELNKAAEAVMNGVPEEITNKTKRTRNGKRNVSRHSNPKKSRSLPGQGANENEKIPKKLINNKSFNHVQAAEEINEDSLDADIEEFKKAIASRKTSSEKKKTNHLLDFSDFQTESDDEEEGVPEKNQKRYDFMEEEEEPSMGTDPNEEEYMEMGLVEPSSDHPLPATSFRHRLPSSSSEEGLLPREHKDEDIFHEALKVGKPRNHRSLQKQVKASKEMASDAFKGAEVDSTQVKERQRKNKEAEDERLRVASPLPPSDDSDDDFVLPDFPVMDDVVDWGREMELSHRVRFGRNYRRSFPPMTNAVFRRMLERAAFEEYSSTIRRIDSEDVVNHLEFRDEMGRNCLHVLASRSVQDETDDIMVAVLRTTGKTLLDQIDNENHTPLHLAVIRGELCRVKVLLNHGVSIAARNAFGLSPLQVAYRSSNPQILRALLQAGGDFTQLLGANFKPTEEMAEVLTCHQLCVEALLSTRRMFLFEEENLKERAVTSSIFIGATHDGPFEIPMKWKHETFGGERVVLVLCSCLFKGDPIKWTANCEDGFEFAETPKINGVEMKPAKDEGPFPMVFDCPMKQGSNSIKIALKETEWDGRLLAAQVVIYGPNRTKASGD